MAEFPADFHSLMDGTTMELAAQFPALNPRLFDSSMSFQSYFSISNDMFCAHQTPEIPGNSGEVFPESNQISQQILSTENESHESRKRRAIDQPQTSSAISTPRASENGINRNKSSGGRKRVKSKEREEEKSGDIVLVRARRGQATDSHSLAERVRRGKINERLRCLQDIVPGCDKSMGMAVMLDEIINYVLSLQRQVEFLSMKLAAASSFNDFNSQTYALTDGAKVMDPIQRLCQLRSGGDEAKELERLRREGCGTLACFQSSWPF